MLAIGDDTAGVEQPQYFGMVGLVFAYGPTPREHAKYLGNKCTFDRAGLLFVSF
jgi:hypothetical protein